MKIFSRSIILNALRFEKINPSAILRMVYRLSTIRKNEDQIRSYYTHVAKILRAYTVIGDVPC